MSTPEQSKAWRERNKEHKRAYEAEYRKSPEYKLKKAIRDKAWRERNRVRKQLNDAAWRKANPDKVAAQTRRYLQKHGPRKRRDVTQIDNYATKICGICGLLIESNYEIDHIIPVSRNGVDDYSNLQITHPICNRVKSNRLQKEMQLDIVVIRELIAPGASPRAPL